MQGGTWPLRLGIVLARGADAQLTGVTRLRPPLDVAHDPAELPAGVTHLAVVPPGVRLAPEFSAHMSAALSASDSCAYSDFAVAGNRRRLSDWSPELARWQDYVGPVVVVPTGRPSAPVARLAAFRAASEVVHVAQPLYDTDEDDPAPVPAAVRAGLDLPYTYDADDNRVLPVRPRVTFVIPTRGSTGRVGGRRTRYLDRCLASVRPALAQFPGRVVVVVGNDQKDDVGYLQRWQAELDDRLVVVTDDPPFNFSRRCNRGGSVGDDEFLAFLNDDIEALTPAWLDQMIALASEPDVGAVGARLLYPDGTVQHGGHVFHAGGVHLLDSGFEDAPGDRGRNLWDREVSGVTAACLVQRRQVWADLGGFDEALPVAFNDVDYCERIRSTGQRIVVCNGIRLLHHESRSRSGNASQWECDEISRRWPMSLGNPDPFTPDARPEPSRPSIVARLSGLLTSRVASP